MAVVLPKTILLRGRGRRREAPAAGSITPGHLLDYNSSGSFVVHATAGGKPPMIVAVEQVIGPTAGALTGGSGIDDAYATNDYVQAEQLFSGCDFYGLVAAAAAAITRGDKLESAGNGTVRKLTTGVPIGEALEAVDNSGGGAAARLKVAVI
jgi:hypothetical protein